MSEKVGNRQPAHESGENSTAAQETIANLRSAIDQNADDPNLRFRLGLALHHNDYPEQAAAAFSECLSRLDPEQHEPIKQMAQTLYGFGRIEDAERFLKLIADQANDPEIYEFLLALGKQRNQPLDNLAILKKLTELRPEETKYLIWQVGINLDNDRPAEALSAFEMLPEDEQQQVGNQFVLAAIRFNLNDREQAKQILQGILEQDPDHAEANSLLEQCEAEAAVPSISPVNAAAIAAPTETGKGETGVSMLRASATRADWNLAERPSVISLRDVGLRYGLIRGVSTREPAWSLKNLDLDIYEGETLGIVGRNGAGKTTLMRVLADLIQPDEGQIEATCGRRMMLSISMGFVPTISGRKNILLYGLLLGESLKTVKQKLEKIIDFSELGEAIDDPVCTYSLGMRARLGFAVAFSAEPDVLLIDEVLGVGDQAFGRKSYEALRRRLEANKTAVLTTHNDIFIRNLCDRAVWLEGGRIKLVGEPNEVVDQYQASQGK